MIDTVSEVKRTTKQNTGEDSNIYNAMLPYKTGNLPNAKPFRKKPYKRPPSRPISPVLGSEEYMVRKIQQTSAIIMKQLLNPNQQIIDTERQTPKENGEGLNNSTFEYNTKICEKPVEIVSNKNKTKGITSYNVEEIQKKIMNHITNLNDGRKKNLINSDISGYDVAIQQIQKQKRLEVSRALRDMCSKSKQTQESSDFINSIIPDMGIKIEDLPQDLIEDLRNTFNIDIDCTHQTEEVISLDTSNSFICNERVYPETYIKPEPIDDPKLFIEDRVNCSSEDVDDVQKSNANNSANFETPVTVVGTHQTEEVISLDTSTSFINERVYPETYIKPEPIDDPKLFIEDRVNCSSEDVDDVQKSNTNNSANFEMPVTTNHETESKIEDSDKTGNVEPTSVIIKKENESENPHDEIADLEENVILDPKEMDLTDNLLSTTEIKNQTGVNIHNMETNQNDNLELDNVNSVNNNFCPSNSALENRNMATQTEEVIDTAEKSIESFLSKHFNQPPESISEAISRMLKIDQCILKLTKYRQCLFNNFKELDNSSNTTNNSEKMFLKDAVPVKKKKKVIINTEISRRVPLLKRKANRQLDTRMKKPNSEVIVFNNLNWSLATDNQNENEEQRKSLEDENIADMSQENLDMSQQNFLEFQDVHEKILVLKVVEDKLVSAAESGKIFFCSLKDGHYTKVLEVSKVPITALLFNKRIEYEDKFSDNSIFVVKPRQEGARKVLLIGSRNSPICIRDAMTGLHMRIMENQYIVSPTVYSLILENNLVYCGTTNYDILVFSFHVIVGTMSFKFKSVPIPHDILRHKLK
ncbi:hypothetical protein NQ314_004561 [Rhamnusium bicolor]|uniref:Uncharacterized protein n=1 Tax=Rhamnusium bicolor TaxID=1586634 RepID=A0AAV8ZKW0_9CUCU|nr:hypothetical protein NQ314_004561 [Rhamnusium bicolor]